MGTDILAFPDMAPERRVSFDPEGTMLLIARRARERFLEASETECLRRANAAMALVRGGLTIDLALRQAEADAAIVKGPEDEPEGVAALIAGRSMPRVTCDRIPGARPELLTPAARVRGADEALEAGEDPPAPAKTSEARTARTGDGRLIAHATTASVPAETRAGQPTRPSVRSPAAEAPSSRGPLGEINLDMLVLAELDRRVVAQAYDIAGEPGLPDGPPEVLESLGRLLKRGLVERRGSGRVVVWKVVRVPVANGGLS